MLNLKRIVLGLTPTPLQRLGHIEKALGLNVELYAKRDDLLGCILGGNKLRKLEYILPLARAENADILVTTGSLESNHVCLTVAAARMLGLGASVLLMRPLEGPQANLNLQIEQWLGAQTVILCYAEEDRARLGELVDARLAELLRDLESRGRRPFIVPPGGCCLEGTAAFVHAFDELHAQMGERGRAAYDIVLAVGTGSTFAGLWCGARAAKADVEVFGISIARPRPRCEQETAKSIVRLSEPLGLEPPAAEALSVTDEFVGSGYARPTEAARQAAEAALKHEGLLLDPTYTAKAFAGLLAMVRAGRIGARPVVFWHTGGVAGAVDALMAAPGGRGEAGPA